ncbi:HNH endonuclease [Paeniglutamicibacter sp. Y32M11]|uniref:HNH endonuclease n=1 Tax=Paeniglutamicibacter sp. Y32M11 TaxID=2853258 RepID=UPI001C530C40|nr:HNH endonuclease signature motif containing protein [Paeniglutamicibacter sp. Y32M11]QXQ09970.1 HNH endonuclease [Paeniglutamicibacter sp. Y32M11]
MATTSSPQIPGTLCAVPGEELSNAALIQRGVEIGALVAEYLASAGAAALRVLATVVNETPMEGTAFDRVEALGAFEYLKSAASARQADLACAHEDAVVATRKSAGVREKNPSWGIGAEVALVLRQPRCSGVEFLHLSRVISRDLPLTRAAVGDDTITFHQAEIVARGVRHLKKENQLLIEELLFTDCPLCFAGGDALLRESIHQWALLLEPELEEDSEQKARVGRYLHVYRFDAYRMRIDGLVPVEYGAAILQVLAREEGRGQAAGDERTRGQIAADYFLTSMTGFTDHENMRVRLNLVMTEGTFFTGEGEPALIPGFGYISADRSRKLLLGTWQNPEDIEVVRLYTAPGAGDLVAMDSKARVISGKLKWFVMLRDQHCRTPGCNGLIREIDHVVQAARGGPSSVENIDGRCRSCNATKESPGWVEETVPGVRHGLRVTTSSGQMYESVAPRLPGLVEQLLWRLNADRAANPVAKDHDKA